MKKLFRLVAIMLACLAIADCNAQSTWHFGVKAGLNLADEAMKNEATDMVAGLHVGAIANYRLNDLFDIEADIVYSQQGVVDKGIEVMDNSGMEASDTHLQFRSQYINVPLTLKWFGNDHFYAEGGPQFGYQLARKLSLSGKYILDGPINQDVESQNLHRFDFGALLGLGYVFDNGLLLNARYVWSFTDTTNDFLVNVGSNRNLQLSVGYLF